MSRLNGDRARFQKNRKRKMLRRQRIQQLLVNRVHPPEPGPIRKDSVKGDQK